MPVTKRAFPCGHRGHGKKCHRCATADELTVRSDLDYADPDAENQARLLRMTDSEARAERERVRQESERLMADQRAREARELARLQRIDDAIFDRPS